MKMETCIRAKRQLLLLLRIEKFRFLFSTSANVSRLARIQDNRAEARWPSATFRNMTARSASKRKAGARPFLISAYFPTARRFVARGLFFRIFN